MSTQLWRLDLERKLTEEIQQLARLTGNPEEVVYQEVLIAGLKSYKTTPSKSAKAVLDLIEWAEKHQVKSTVWCLSYEDGKRSVHRYF